MNDDNKLKSINRILIYGALVAGILFLRLIADYPTDIIDFSTGIVIIFEKIMIALGIEDLMIIISKIPIIALIFASGIFKIAIGLILLFVFKSTAEQGTMIMIKKPIKLIAIGNIVYILGLILFFIFTVSVIGLPIAIIIGIIGYIVSFLGCIPLAIFLGYNICNMLNVSGYTYMYYMIGSFFMVLCQSVYAIGVAFSMYVFPVLSIGTFIILLLNKFVFKMSYKIEFNTKREKQPFDRKKIKDIITKGL